ncbi:response regulator transcription factor [Thiomicrorhabdus sp. 6S2-11]|uniref:Response regulator transcription factor n=1 Tax=Thiomicrorhabdus marina TaxID=2818442 RepID=A0ABS3Q3C7_9GAMM|nr:response regulator transcription factor [Thiomicrorhabdus marina]MBO1926776.1 response regulator transcription factor [Thiomicrorhabdus marina]
MSEKITIVLAEDHSLVRAGFKSILDAHEDMEVVGEAEDGLECLELVRSKSPNILLLDLSMPKLSGMNVINHIKKRYTDTKVIVLTAAETLSVWKDVLDLGVGGLSMKSVSPKELTNGIREVHNGGSFIHSEIQPSLEAADGLKNRRLSVREKQVVKLVAEGHKTKEIAEMLEISDRTVSKHRENLMSKLGIDSTAELTKYANESGLTRVGLEEIE